MNGNYRRITNFTQNQVGDRISFIPRGVNALEVTMTPSFSRAQTAKLEEAFIANEYPSAEMVSGLSATLSVEERLIKSWFKDKRIDEFMTRRKLWGPPKYSVDERGNALTPPPRNVAVPTNRPVPVASQAVCAYCDYYADHAIPVPPLAGAWSDAINRNRGAGGDGPTTIGGERTTIGGERTTIGGGRTTIGGGRTTTGGGRTTTGGESDGKNAGGTDGAAHVNTGGGRARIGGKSDGKNNGVAYVKTGDGYVKIGVGGGQDLTKIGAATIGFTGNEFTIIDPIGGGCTSISAIRGDNTGIGGSGGGYTGIGATGGGYTGIGATGGVNYTGIGATGGVNYTGIGATGGGYTGIGATGGGYSGIGVTGGVNYTGIGGGYIEMGASGSGSGGFNANLDANVGRMNTDMAVAGPSGVSGRGTGLSYTGRSWLEEASAAGRAAGIAAGTSAAAAAFAAAVTGEGAASTSTSTGFRVPTFVPPVFRDPVDRLPMSPLRRRRRGRGRGRGLGRTVDQAAVPSDYRRFVKGLLRAGQAAYMRYVAELNENALSV